MNFELTEEQLLVQSTAARFTRDHIEPFAASFDEGRDLETYIANLKQLGTLGFLSMGVSEKFGGSGFDTMALGG
ncbi:acyl-CoA dehydrogenase family protein [Gammaproteobacteria bacterium]|jgi:alkylation response protein AidB-like acyl-CoA dehydrogenase|nr:acyl-CoA dehydrogenase family protein [Gammaproteobacteria bacterium]|tara:strand:+ start:57 stop:278 length:222 start_codon:yes stop_codon:yes gene_type:complete